MQDLFYEAENSRGERGLVPSNYVEPVADEQLLHAATSSTVPPPATNTSTQAYALHDSDPALHEWNALIQGKRRHLDRLDACRNDIPAPPLNVNQHSLRTNNRRMLQLTVENGLKQTRIASPISRTHDITTVDDYTLSMRMGDPVGCSYEYLASLAAVDKFSRNARPERYCLLVA